MYEKAILRAKRTERHALFNKGGQTMKKSGMDSAVAPPSNIFVPAGDHYSLDAVQALVASRRAQGEAWEMPDHLSECALCLEAYELLLADLPQVPEKSRYRFIELRTEQNHLAVISWKRWIGKAAAIILLLGLGALILMNLSSPALKPAIAKGRVVSPVGHPLVAGQVLPVNDMVLAEEPTDLRCADGSRIHLDSKTQFRFYGGLMSRSIIELWEGSIECDIQPQKNQRFVVRTSLGEVRVIGTRFSVTSRQEQVTIFNNNQGTGEKATGATSRIATVVVRVKEGKVLVMNFQERVVLEAGQAATLRENQPLIDVTEFSL